MFHDASLDWPVFYSNLLLWSIRIDIFIHIDPLLKNQFLWQLHGVIMEYEINQVNIYL